MTDIPPNALGDLIKLLIAVLAVMGAGFVGFAKLLRDTADRQRGHELQMAERYERMGDKFGAAVGTACSGLSEVVTEMKEELIELRHGQEDICRAQACPHRVGPGH